MPHERIYRGTEILNLPPACKLNALLKLWSDAHPTTLLSPLIYLSSRCWPILWSWALPVTKQICYSLSSLPRKIKTQGCGLLWRVKGSSVVSWHDGKALYLCWAHTWPTIMRLNRLFGMVASWRAASPNEVHSLLQQEPRVAHNRCQIVGSHVARHLLLQPPSFLSWPAEWPSATSLMGSVLTVLAEHMLG